MEHMELIPLTLKEYIDFAANGLMVVEGWNEVGKIGLVMPKIMF
jgi:hypothetical protein